MIGKQLKQARLASEYSLSELKNAIGNLVSSKTLERFEKNEEMPKSSVLMALSSSLDVPIGYFASLPPEGVNLRNNYIKADRERFLEALGEACQPDDEQRFKQICLKAFEGGEVGLSRLAEVLQVHIMDVEDYLETIDKSFPQKKPDNIIYSPNPKES